MNKHKIAEWFFDQFENIIDEIMLMNDVEIDMLEANDEEFHEEISHQSMDSLIRSVCLSCASKLGLSYDEVYDSLEEKLEELYYAITA